MILDSCHSTVACICWCKYAVTEQFKRTLAHSRAPVLQRVEENRHKETPRRLVGHSPSDDKNTFRGLRNSIGLEPVSKLVQAEELDTDGD